MSALGEAAERAEMNAPVAAYARELMRTGILGVCVFDRAGGVRETHGHADWAPPPGAALEDSPLFVGMGDALRQVAEGGAPFDLPAVRLGARSCDFRVMRLPDCEHLAVVSIDAGERFALLRPAKEIERRQRLADELAFSASSSDSLRELLALFVERAPAAVAVIDRDLREVVASERWRALYALRAATLSEDEGVFSAAERAEFLRLSIDNGVPVSRVEKSRREGAPRWTRWEQAPWRGPDGRIEGAFVFSEDVTESVGKLARSEREAARLEAVAQDLAALARGAARSLTDGEGAASAAQVAQALARYERLTALEPRLEPLSLAEPLAAAAAALQEEARRVGATIALGPLLGVRGDRALLLELFRELLGNCLRHGGEAPHVYVDCLRDDAGILVRVTDDGPGVPPPLRPRALDFFERLPKGEPAGAGAAAGPGGEGVGMGLPLCRRIMEMHEGVLALDPGWDAGLRIALTFPHVPAA